MAHTNSQIHSHTLHTHYTHVLDIFGLLGRLVLAPGNDSDEVLCEDKGDTLPVDAKFLLLVVQEMTKVNVEYLQITTNTFTQTLPRVTLTIAFQNLPYCLN